MRGYHLGQKTQDRMFFVRDVKTQVHTSNFGNNNNYVSRAGSTLEV